VKVLWHGFDRLDLAIKAIIPQALLASLQTLRERAEQANERQRTYLGPGKLDSWVEQHGMKGGYRYQIDTGPIGFRLSIKANSDPSQWNIFVTASNGALLTGSFDGTVDQLFDELDKLGLEPQDESVNRVDYAVDVLLDEITLDPGLLVVPPGTKTKEYREPPHGRADHSRKAEYRSVMKGGRVQSLTCGSMPGRQVILYDKLADVVQKQKFHMFDVWGMDPRKTNQNVLRIEARAGKRELKERWALSSLRNVRDSIGDVFMAAMDDFRLLAPGQIDSNFARHASHKAWAMAQDTMAKGVQWAVSGLTRGQLVKRERDKVSAHATQNLIAHAVRKAAASAVREVDELKASLAALDATKQALQLIPEQELKERFAKVTARLEDAASSSER